ncbi:hypothetical protein J437_LFUL005304 [Ladona fulva]|uniref:Uncharacterized protein n=1 Tax=Ladona fulva TaxID=123851 RepID=A0A8K0K1N6_LADFU|nr:hypothetical protein J437_LFUL005304 [Ladona fulva]
MTKMPSKEEMCLSTNDATGTTTSSGETDFFSRDMEELVYEIKENLRLSGFKGQPSLPSAFAAVVKQKRTNAPRASPYRIPVRHGALEDVRPGDSCKSCLRTLNRGKTKQQTEDPYGRLQELLREGSLIKEAVRRLQLGLSPKQRYFYDEDDVSKPIAVGSHRICDV